MKKALLLFLLLLLALIWWQKDFWIGLVGSSNQEHFSIDYQPFELKEILLKSGYTVKEGPFWEKDNEGLRARLGERIEVIFSTKKDFLKQVATLQSIIREAKIEQERRGVIIDLRGNKPYVSFKNNSGN
jgi:hypothetical protein